MLKKAITLTTLISFIIYAIGCSAIEVVQLNESRFDDVKDSNIVSVVTMDYKIYEFDTKGIKPKPEINDSVLIGWAVATKYKDDYTLREIKIPLNEIKSFSVEKVDAPMGILTTIGVAVAIIFVTTSLYVGNH